MITEDVREIFDTIRVEAAAVAAVENDPDDAEQEAAIDDYFAFLLREYAQWAEGLCKEFDGGERITLPPPWRPKRGRR